jgi:hypothetical protein
VALKLLLYVSVGGRPADAACEEEHGRDAWVRERTACDRLVGRLVSYSEPEGICSRLGMGVFLLRRSYEALSSEATRDLPINGIKEVLVAHGQGGQLYRHLDFHIGCRFLGWPGMLASWFMNLVDAMQAATGRVESVVEARDNVAALACAEVLLDRSRRRISRREAAERLREILAEPAGSR